MRVRVHRGCQEIGGSCVEVESGGSRIVLDVGKPLNAGWDEQVPLPLVDGLGDGGDPSLLGVLVSHPHLDHYGLIGQVSPRVPVYSGRAAAAVVEAARFFTPAAPSLRPAGYLRDRQPLELGPFTITPHLVDHSAYDSYAMVVDDGEARLLYTGDLRGHGRKGRLFEKMVAAPPVHVDTLLMEGTHVPRQDAPARTSTASTESTVEIDMVATFRATAGLAAVVSSAQNIDRVVTVYRAARRAGRILLVDLYTATVAQATGRATIPSPGFPDLGVFIPRRQRVMVKDSGQFHRTAAVSSHRVYPEELTTHPERYVVLSTSAAIPELLSMGALRDGVVVWSLWSGYLAEPSGARLRARVGAAGLPFVEHHTSGHATLVDLQRLAAAVNPGQVVPIHTEGAQQFARHFARAVPQRDGTWWDVAPDRPRTGARSSNPWSRPCP